MQAPTAYRFRVSLASPPTRPSGVCTSHPRPRGARRRRHTARRSRRRRAAHGAPSSSSPPVAPPLLQSPPVVEGGGARRRHIPNSGPPLVHSPRLKSAWF